MRDGPLGERRVGMSSQSSAASGLAHELVVVFRRVDEASVVELHLVRRDHARRHALLAVHERDDGALLEAAARVARDRDYQAWLGRTLSGGMRGAHRFAERGAPLSP